jgi:glutamate N-acetyltransferase/amino-acid N-acetyltransferase
MRRLAKPLAVSALPRGFEGAGATCGIKPSKKPDLALIVSDRPASVALVTTQNQFAAPPIHITREHAQGGRARAIIIDSGNANCATGKRGLADARQMCALTAKALGVKATEVLVNSTGVVGVPLPMEKVEAGIPEVVARVCPAGINDAAVAMMSTDQTPKRATRRWSQGRAEVRLAAIGKGVGMIHPNMATMIAVMMTDATIAPALLRRALRQAVNASFNCLTVDGDTSTNDMVAVFANGASEATRIDKVSSTGFDRLVGAMMEVCQEIVHAMAADGEGASRVAIIRVKGSRTPEEARTIARAVGSSSLVKTAIHGADPNWGRIVVAVGNAGVEIDPMAVSVSVAGTALLRKGKPVKFNAKSVSRAMTAPDVRVEVDMGLGRAEATCWSSSLTEEYVRFNSAYTT